MMEILCHEAMDAVQVGASTVLVLTLSLALGWWDPATVSAVR